MYIINLFACLGSKAEKKISFGSSTAMLYFYINIIFLFCYTYYKKKEK